MSRGEIVRSGYLTKSPPDAQKMAQWKRRWFVLADSRLVYPLADRYVRLEYYANEMEAKRLADPKGVINLTGCTRVITREPIKGHRSVFDVCTADRVYHLAAESVAEKAEWIHTLNRLLFTDKNKTPAPWQVHPDGRIRAMSPPGHRFSEPDISVQAMAERRPRSFTAESKAHPPSSRPLPPVPPEESKSRPLPPTPTDPLHRQHKSPQQNSTSATKVYKPRKPSPLGAHFHPQLNVQRSVPQPISVSEHYEVAPGQKSIIGSAPTRAFPPVPKPRPKPKPKPVVHSHSAETTEADYSYIEDTALDDEYSVLNESSIPGYDPSNDEYSHLEDVTQNNSSRERHTVPVARPSHRGKRKAYENVPHVAQEDGDYSLLKH